MDSDLASIIGWGIIFAWILWPFFDKNSNKETNTGWIIALGVMAAIIFAIYQLSPNDLEIPNIRLWAVIFLIGIFAGTYIASHLFKK